MTLLPAAGRVPPRRSRLLFVLSPSVIVVDNDAATTHSEGLRSRPDKRRATGNCPSPSEHPSLTTGTKVRAVFYTNRRRVILFYRIILLRFYIFVHPTGPFSVCGRSTWTP